MCATRADPSSSVACGPPRAPAHRSRRRGCRRPTPHREGRPPRRAPRSRSAKRARAVPRCRTTQHPRPATGAGRAAPTPFGRPSPTRRTAAAARSVARATSTGRSTLAPRGDQAARPEPAGRSTRSRPRYRSSPSFGNPASFPRIAEYPVTIAEAQHFSGRTARSTVRAMAKKRPRRGGRYTPKGTRPAPSKRAHRERDREPDLLRDVHSMVSAGHPFDLLCGAGQFIEITTERPIDRLRGRDREEHASLGDLVATFIDVDRPETTALLVAFATLVDDELLAARIRREVAGRRDALPDWLQALDKAEITDTWEMVHVLGDGDNILVGVRWPTGHELTAVVYIDHNVGTLVKDAYIVAEGPDALVGKLRRMVKESGEDEHERGSRPSTQPTRGPYHRGDRRRRDLPPAVRDRVVAGLSQCRRVADAPTPCWAARATSDPSGPTRNAANLRKRSSRPSTAARSPPGATTMNCSSPCCGSGATTGRAIRCAGAPSRSRSSCSTGSRARSFAPPPLLARMPVVFRAFIRYTHTQRGISAPLTARDARGRRRVRAASIRS